MMMVEPTTRECTQLLQRNCFVVVVVVADIDDDDDVDACFVYS